MKAEIMDEYVIRPVLERMATAHADLRLASESSVEIMHGIIAVESGYGKYNRQIKGPAVGICQIEPSTLDWLYHDVLTRKKYKALKALFDLYDLADDPLASVESNWYACVFMGRLRLWVEVEPLAPSGDIQGHAEYWDTHYNVNPDKGFAHEFVAKYNKYMTL